MRHLLWSLLLCTLLWSPSLTYTDGRPVSGIVRYVVSYQPRRGAVQTWDTEQAQLLFDRCLAGTYWVQAYHAADGSDTSARSNTVSVKPGKGKP